MDPYEPATAIVTEGPYRFNPPYVGMTLMYAGFTTRADALPAAVLLSVVLAVMRRGVIERGFGDEYLRYKEGVSRWI